MSLNETRGLYSSREYFVICGKTNMRRQIDGLATTITEEYDMEVYNNEALFLFCGGKKDRFNALNWEGDGLVL